MTAVFKATIQQTGIEPEVGSEAKPLRALHAMKLLWPSAWQDVPSGTMDYASYVAQPYAVVLMIIRYPASNRRTCWPKLECRSEDRLLIRRPLRTL